MTSGKGQRTESLGAFELCSYACLDSTNIQAERLVSHQPLEKPTIIWALEQEKGRGRQGRHWHSPPGNLYATFVFPSEKPRLPYPLLSLAASLAVGLSLTELTQSMPYQPLIRLKWPNDILLNGRKTAGLLLEIITTPYNRYPALLIGIGVNVALHPLKTATIIYPATSLKAEGIEEVSVFQVLDKIQTMLWQWYHHWLEGRGEVICSTWQNHAAFLNESIEARYKVPPLKGIFKGINLEGHMLLQTTDGQLHTIMIGDVLQGAIENPLRHNLARP